MPGPQGDQTAGHRDKGRNLCVLEAETHSTKRPHAAPNVPDTGSRAVKQALTAPQVAGGPTCISLWAGLGQI